MYALDISLQCNLIRFQLYLFKVLLSTIYPIHHNKFLSLLLLLRLHVGRNKELSKETEKTQDVNKVGSSVIVTVSLAFLVSQKVDSLAHHGNELGQLHKSQRRFPPDRQVLSSFRYLGVHTDEVVCVHNSVDESVQYNGKVNISVVLCFGINPVEQKDCEMMVYVKERKLSPFLSKDDEDGVPEIPDLGYIK